MKKWLAVSIAALAVCVASTAFAQVGADGTAAKDLTGQRIAGIDASGITRVLRTDTSGNLYAVTGATVNLTTNAINDTVTFGLTPFAAESTTVLRYGVDGYKWCAVWFTAKQAAGDTSVIRVALEARAHVSTAADSLNMAVIPDWSLKGCGALLDSTGTAGTNVFGASGSAVALNVPWYGEHVVVVNPTRGYGGVAEANQYFGFPNNFYFPLVTAGGANIPALYVSFRARVLAPTSASSKVRLVMHVVMGT